MKKQLESLGFFENPRQNSKEYIHQYIKLRLEALGLVGSDNQTDDSDGFLQLAKSLIINYRERERHFKNYLCPADQRIQNFINNYFATTEIHDINIPSFTFTLDFYGIARELSMPEDKQEYKSEYLTSYRVKQGVLHNPKSDRRTTQGVFHIAEGGLPIPDDKKAVPIKTAAMLLKHAVKMEGDMFNLPFTNDYANKAKVFVSLLLRPLVAPAVEGITQKKTMEIRFFAPGSLVSNLDFVESIFGNGGSDRKSTV